MLENSANPGRFQGKTNSDKRRVFYKAVGILKAETGVGNTEIYLDLVLLLNIVVDLLLLLGTNHLCGFPTSILRTILAAVLGGVYAAACLLPGFHFLGNLIWRIVSLGLMGVMAFGCSRYALRASLVFGFLVMALGGVASGLGEGSFWKLILAAGGVAVLCRYLPRTRVGNKLLVPVVLSYGGKEMRVTALHDTGNTLYDPVTGAPVLVIGAEVAQAFTGLTSDQLRDPTSSIVFLPGSRLIPYKAVGGGGMLLAIRFPKVRIGTWQGSYLVAFAPQCLSDEGTYQALTGGVL